MNKNDGWIENDLIRHLSTSATIKKLCANNQFAQNLYAALCNMQWQLHQEEPQSLSWRRASRLIADIRQQDETYLDWYCSGSEEIEGYVEEGTVTPEVESVLKELGWTKCPWPN